MLMLMDSRKPLFAYKLDAGLQSGDAGEIMSTASKPSGMISGCSSAVE